MKREPFSNATIVGPNPNKPHIVKRHGRWRVSPMPKKRTLESAALWSKAHGWANSQNAKIAFENFQRDMTKVQIKLAIPHG